jgi:uncharacterized OB-fold protein
MRGTVYTETVVWSAPEAYLADAPYQLAIIIQEDGKRVTGRIIGNRAAIDDVVELAETRDGVPFFRLAGPGA